MRIVVFCHSLLSDWNHGNAHFLRGVVSELVFRGHEVRVFEPRDAWSIQNLLAERGGAAALEEVLQTYPAVRPVRYELARFDLDEALDGADVVIVHEWNEHALVKGIGERRARGGSFKLLFHDTHHRSVTDESSMGAYDLRHYDGVLAFGREIRDLYLKRGWTQRAWTWHEAADTRVFRPLRAQGTASASPERASGLERAQGAVREEGDADLVWVGNWGDEERTAELHEFLLQPVKTLGLRATVHGVRYPEPGLQALAESGCRFGGWLPNHRVPVAFARARVTVHIPRRPYVRALPGIPTIRPFEALACGIPLISAPWDDTEQLFTPGRDFLVAPTGAEMTRLLRDVLNDDALRSALITHGLRTVQRRHTCAHRVDELLAIVGGLGIPSSTERSIA
ncbi:MAG: glycosyltransferase [Myxococcaceae bacterium]